jgi:hypothetical protein
MSRAWRIEYGGALYHLISSGNGSQAIYFRGAEENLNYQIPNFKLAPAVSFEVPVWVIDAFGYWDFFGIWVLEFGIFMMLGKRFSISQFTL